MSWSFYAIGTPKGVLHKAREEFAKYACAEPEETVRQKVLHQLEAICLSSPDSISIKVEAFGSQGSWDGAHCHNLTVKIEPVHGFAKDPVE